MLYKYKQKLVSLSRNLRREMTESERLLWKKIRGKQLNSYQFNRQKPIDDFIVDFYCCRAMLAIEIDGGQHYEKENEKKDKLRDDRLKQLGIKVLRFTLNYETPLTPPLLDQGGVGGGNFKFRNYPTSILPLFKGRRNTSFVIQKIYQFRCSKKYRRRNHGNTKGIKSFPASLY